MENRWQTTFTYDSVDDLDRLGEMGGLEATVCQLRQQVSNSDVRMGELVKVYAAHGAANGVHFRRLW